MLGLETTLLAQRGAGASTMTGMEAGEIYAVWDNGNLLCRTTVARS